MSYKYTDKERGNQVEYEISKEQIEQRKRQYQREKELGLNLDYYDDSGKFTELDKLMMEIDKYIRHDEEIPQDKLSRLKTLQLEELKELEEYYDRREDIEVCKKLISFVYSHYGKRVGTREGQLTDEKEILNIIETVKDRWKQ